MYVIWLFWGSLRVVYMLVNWVCEKHRPACVAACEYCGRLHITFRTRQVRSSCGSLARAETLFKSSSKGRTVEAK